MQARLSSRPRGALSGQTGAANRSPPRRARGDSIRCLVRSSRSPGGSGRWIDQGTIMNRCPTEGDEWRATLVSREVSDAPDRRSVFGLTSANESLGRLVGCSWVWLPK